MVSGRITFGVEIECAIPASLVLEAASLKLARGAKPAGWKAVHDGSIQAPEGFVAVEFVSPKLSGEAGLAAAVAAVEKLAALGAQVNESCGLHVHISSPGWESDADFLLEAFAAVQDKFLALGGREANQFCRELDRQDRWLEKFNKYQTITVWQPKKGAEIRAFAGTLEPEPFRNRLELALYFWQGLMIGSGNLGGWDYVLEIALEDGGAPAGLIEWVKAAGLWSDPVGF